MQTRAATARIAPPAEWGDYSFSRVGDGGADAAVTISASGATTVTPRAPLTFTAI